LGKVVALLLSRPEDDDMDEAALELAVQATMELQQQPTKIMDKRNIIIILVIMPKNRRLSLSPTLTSNNNNNNNKKNSNAKSSFWPRWSNAVAVRFNSSDIYWCRWRALQAQSQQDHKEWLRQSGEWTRNNNKHGRC
jgi:hypothetical protein